MHSAGMKRCFNTCPADTSAASALPASSVAGRALTLSMLFVLLPVISGTGLAQEIVLYNFAGGPSEMRLVSMSTTCCPVYVVFATTIARFGDFC